MHILNLTFILNNIAEGDFLPALRGLLQSIPHPHNIYSVQGAGNADGQIFCVQFHAGSPQQLQQLRTTAIAPLQAAASSRFGQSVLLVSTTLNRL